MDPLPLEGAPAEPARLDVPADIYDEALAFCNRRRDEKGLRPIQALPAGFAEEAESCPCANAVPGIRVETKDWCFTNDWRWRHDTPSRFIELFDRAARANTLTLPVRKA